MTAGMQGGWLAGSVISPVGHWVSGPRSRAGLGHRDQRLSWPNQQQQHEFSNEGNFILEVERMNCASQRTRPGSNLNQNGRYNTP